MSTEKSFQDHFVNAIISSLKNIFSFLFLTPLELWKKAIVRISLQQERKALNIEHIHTNWPFLSYLRSYLLEFLYDGLILFAYPVGVSIVVFNEFADGLDYFTFSTFLYELVLVYYSPIGLSVIRDLNQLILLPIRKFINWVSKPAQHMDLTVVNKHSNGEAVKTTDRKNAQTLDDDAL